MFESELVLFKIMYPHTGTMNRNGSFGTCYQEEHYNYESMIMHYESLANCNTRNFVLLPGKIRKVLKLKAIKMQLKYTLNIVLCAV